MKAQDAILGLQFVHFVGSVAQPATVAGSRVFATENTVPMTRDAAILADCATSTTNSKPNVETPGLGLHPGLLLLRASGASGTYNLETVGYRPRHCSSAPRARNQPILNACERS